MKKRPKVDVHHFNLIDKLKESGLKPAEYEPGSHWVSMYVDLLPNNNRENPTIYFFDSVGDKPPKEIKRLIKNNSKQY